MAENHPGLPTIFEGDFSIEPAGPTAKTGEARSSSRRKSRGRPKGSQTAPKPVANAPASRCPKCDGTNRTPYTNTRTVDASGTEPDGAVYDQVTFRRTICRDCGQHRVDRTPRIVSQKSSR